MGRQRSGPGSVFFLSWLLPAVILAGAPAAEAQRLRPRQPEPIVTPRGYVEAGYETFLARDTFDAIFGRSDGAHFGGGVDVKVRYGLFVRLGASRFEANGERVLRLNNRVYKLGIPLKVTMTPVELTGGYRFLRLRRFTAYGGAGIGSYRYKETSEFAAPEENVDTSFTSHHALVGGEVRVWRWISAGAEVQVTRVPDAIGQDGISKEFGETDLGGTTARLRIVIGR